MDKIGQSRERNKDYIQKFDRTKVIKSLIKDRDAIIFDVGAHMGESVIYLRKIFPDSIIYSFEPDRESYKKLLFNKKQNHYCYNFALSNTNGQISFYKNKISHTNSILKVNKNSTDSIKIQQAIKSGTIENELNNYNQEIKVKSIKLDDFILEHNISKINLLKIDVQGAEKLVIQGANLALDFIDIIIVEISFFDYYTNKSNFLDIEKILIPKGFELFSISEISYNPMNGRTDWAEVIYRKTTYPPPFV